MVEGGGWFAVPCPASSTVPTRTSYFKPAHEYGLLPSPPLLSLCSCDVPMKGGVVMRRRAGLNVVDKQIGWNICTPSHNGYHAQPRPGHAALHSARVVLEHNHVHNPVQRHARRLYPWDGPRLLSIRDLSAGLAHHQLRQAVFAWCLSSRLHLCCSV